MNILSEELLSNFFRRLGKGFKKPGLLEGAPEEDLNPGMCGAASPEHRSQAGHLSRDLGSPPYQGPISLLKMNSLRDSQFD